MSILHDRGIARHRSAWLAGWSLALLCGMLVSYGVGVRVNVSPSLPLGIYRIHPITNWLLQRGTLVIACPPPAAAQLARTRSYLAQGSCPGNVMPIGKRIAAMPGDTVSITPDGILVNQQHLPHSRARVWDRQARPLHPLSIGQYVLSANAIWLTGDTADSWDSRYFGAVSSTMIRAMVTPVWTAPPDRDRRNGQ